MENKKTKLTISGGPKKSFKNIDSVNNQGKKTVIIVSHNLKNLEHCDSIYEIKNFEVEKKKYPASVITRPLNVKKLSSL